MKKENGDKNQKSSVSGYKTNNAKKHTKNESTVSSYITNEKKFSPYTKSTVSSYKTHNNDNEQCLSSSTVHGGYYFYHSIKNNHITKYCNNIQYPSFREYLHKWFEILFKTDYLKIIYYLIENEYCHVSGLQKTLCENARNLSKKLNTLTKYGITKIANKEKYRSDLYKHRYAFRIDDWHFERADWYKLTDLGFLFYKTLDFTISLNPVTIDNIKNYQKHLSKKTKEIEIKKEKQRDRFDELFSKYKNLKELRPELDPIQWAIDKIKRGFVSNISPESLVSELEKRLQEGEKTDG